MNAIVPQAHPRPGARRGFSLMELMVVLGIIALLTGLAFTALHHVKNNGDVVAERAMVVALKEGVAHHQQLFGFPPPLVLDTPNTPGPVKVTGQILIWNARDLSDRNTSLNGSTGQDDRHCYSQYSLSYYLAGSLGVAIDKVESYGFTAPSPSHDGSFSGKGQKYEPFVDLTRFKTRAGLVRGVTLPPPGSTVPVLAPDLARAVWASRTVILDRWSDGSGFAANDRYIRYYRWEPGYYTATGGADPAPAANQVGQIHYWNVPVAVGGDPVNTNPPKNAELKSATWAIVSAGPDRKFGDETSIGNPNDAADNLIEVGR